ncbi:MAG: hypothetical protein E7033_07750, partial [Akkermansiaceae bacterium]|nr:hypothetical protein [Akkermansiaceae bacterium]
AIRAEEARKAEEARLIEEAIRAEEARKAEEARLIEEAIRAEAARKAEAARQNTAPQTVQSPIVVETLGVRTVIEAPATQPPSPVPATEQQPQN